MKISLGCEESFVKENYSLSGVVVLLMFLIYGFSIIKSAGSVRV